MSAKCKYDWDNIIKVGSKFNLLTVVESPDKINCETKIKCQCDCGKTAYILAGDLISGHTRSCGCLHDKISGEIGKRTIRLAIKSTVDHARFSSNIYCEDFKSNELKRMRTYFSSMHTRSFKGYHNNTQICEEWSWSIQGWQEYKLWFLKELARLNLSLAEFNSSPRQYWSVDRIDNDGDYSPKNCRLATMSQQNRNRGDAVKINGVHILDIADRYHFSHHAAYAAYYRGTFDRLLSKYQKHPQN